jgi:hypothetical protein
MLEFRHQLLEETLRPTRAERAQQLKAIDEALRQFIQEQLTGDIRARVGGVVLIVLGLIVTTIEGVWAILSS